MVNRRGLLGLAGTAGLAAVFPADAQEATPTAGALDFVVSYVDRVLHRRDVSALADFVAADYAPERLTFSYAPAGRDALAQRLIDAWASADAAYGAPSAVTFLHGFASADGSEVAFQTVTRGPDHGGYAVQMVKLRGGKIVGGTGGYS